MKFYLIYLFLISNLMYAQDTVSVVNPYKFKSVNSHKFRVSYSLTEYPKIFLTKQRTIITPLSDTLKIWKIKFNSKLLDKKLQEENTYCIFYYKEKIIEKGYWKEEFFVGTYQRFYKNGQLQKEGEYTVFGQETGIWRYYNKKGRLTKTVEFEDGRKK